MCPYDIVYFFHYPDVLLHTVYNILEMVKNVITKHDFQMNISSYFIRERDKNAGG